MNKYTLTFTDELLEEYYVINKRQKIQQPIYWYVVVAGIIILTANVVISLVNENYEGFYYKLGVMLYLFLSGMIVFKKKKLTNTSLIIVNLIIVLLEQELRTDYDVYDGFLQGSNQMIVHVILLIVTEFKLAIFTNFMLGGLRLLLTAINSNGIEITQYIYTILIMICLSMILYQAEKHQREYYLLSVKDNSWENFLSKILQKPFFTFTFDKENCKFRKQIQRISGIFEDLDQFLENCKFKHIPLKNYILQLLQQRAIDQREQLKVAYEGKHYNITFISCYLDQLTLIVTFDSEDSYLKTIIQSYEKKYQIIQKAFTVQVKVTGKVIREYLRHKNKSLLIDLKITLFESYLLQDIKKAELELVDLKRMLGKLFKNFKLLSYNIELFCPQEVVEQRTLKKYWFLFILELFRKLNQNQKTKFSIFQYGNAIRLTINGLQGLPTSELYYKCHNMLIKEEVRTNQSKYIIIINVGIVFLFRNTPQLSYALQY